LPHVGYIFSDGGYGTDACNDDSSLAHKGVLFSPLFLEKIAFFGPYLNATLKKIPSVLYKEAK
jgi:hypothetical protein